MGCAGVARFFFEQTGRVNASYPNLLVPVEKEEDAVEGTGSEDRYADGSGTGGEDGFADKWGWIANVDRCSETIRESWDYVFRMPVMEFLNILSYRKDRDDREKAAIEELKRKN